MPPATKRDVSVILFDLNIHSEALKSAREFVYNLCASKFFFDSKDTTKIVLLNSAETRNSLHGEYGGYEHIYEASDEIMYDPALIKPYIESDMRKAKGNWLEGLIVCLHILKDEFASAKGVQSLQILFITDLLTPLTDTADSNATNVAAIIKGLSSLSAYLYVVGPLVKIPFTLSSRTDIEKWKNNLEFVCSESENPNLTIVKSVVKSTNSIVCDFKIGIQLFKCYKKHWNLQPWNVPLSFGTILNINVSTCRFLREQESTHIKEKGEGLLWKWVDSEDLTKQVDNHNVIGGIAMYDQFIPLPDDIADKFKCKGERSFKILGFTDSCNIPEYFLRGDGSHMVVANETDPSSQKALCALVQTLAELKVYAIARRVYMANTRPKLVVLIPEPKHKCFIMVELPYADDIKKEYQECDPHSFKTDKSVDPNIKNEVHSFLDYLDVSKHPLKDDASGSVKLPLGINYMPTIHTHVLAQNALKKYLDETADDFYEPSFEDLNWNLASTSKAEDLKKSWPKRELKVSGEEEIKDKTKITQDSGFEESATTDYVVLDANDLDEEEFPF